MDFFAPRVWSIGLDVLEKLREHHKGFTSDDRRQYKDILAKLSDGWAISRVGSSASDYVDSVSATAMFLTHYLTRFGACDPSKNFRYHLDRDPATFEIIAQPGVLYWDFLLDRGSAQSFATGIKARNERLQFQVAMLDSFWDISSHLRARRVYDLILRSNHNHKPGVK